MRVPLLDDPSTSEPDHLTPIARHFIAPCRCSRGINGDGETCAICGRYSLGTLLAAALDWYRWEGDAGLRTLRRENAWVG